MATTGQNFVRVTGSTPVLNGSAVATPPYLDAMGPKEAMSASELDQVAGGSGAAVASAAGVVDRVTFDLSLTALPTVGSPQPVPVAYGSYVGAFAKNGCQLMTLSGTTPESLDLTDLTANTPASYAGDTTFATANVIIFNNVGTHDLVISPGASNPASLPKMTGTSPTFTVAAGSVVAFHSAAGATVDSTHKIITVTPTAGGNLAISVGGA
jgi:hypothetical protein